MEVWFWVIAAMLICIIVVLGGKIFLLRKGAREIREEFSQRLTGETNTLISILSRDRQMQHLAESINEQLRILRKQRHLFQQGDQELKNAVTNISHDLRTPLTAICGYLELLQREETSEEVRKYLSRIEDRTNVLKQLTEELFRYSVVTSVQQVVMEETDLGRIFEETMLSFYDAMEKRGIVPQISLPHEPVLRNIDQVAFRRVLNNVISNGLKYSDGDFLAELTEDGKLTFSNRAESLNAIDVGKLFDRFYTVETGSRSTGLGLSIARLLTERMGGTIRAEYENQRLFIVITFCSI